MTTAQEANFTVTLTPAPTVTVLLNYTTRDGTATAASGAYTLTSGVLTFAPGETVKQVIVPVNLPLAPGSAAELFYLDVTWPSGSVNTITRSPGICNLPGNTTTPLPSVSISSPSVV